MTDLFSVHPAAAFIYFASVLAFTMFMSNPVFILTACLSGIVFFAFTQRSNLKDLCFYPLFFLTVSLTNPLFTHRGATVLFFLNGNPVTLEALLYGVNIAVMLTAVIFWFKSFNAVMTDDKLLFLTAKISPKISLLLSAALRYIPLFKAQAAEIRRSQKAMGLFSSDTWTDKIKGVARVYSALITRSLETAIDAGASMKARGYGLKGRSNYSLYSFKRQDAVFLILVLLLDGAIITAAFKEALEFSFYPSVSAAEPSICGALGITAFAVLCFLPFILSVKEVMMWKYYRSRI